MASVMVETFTDIITKVRLPSGLTGEYVEVQDADTGWLY